MPQLAVMAVGRDRPGIVAAVTGVLVEHGLNVEDSRMAVLRGHFTMMLVVRGEEAVDAAALGADLRAAGRLVGLDLVEAHELPALDDPVREDATHVVTVTGADHPGIVHAIAAALGERSVNILDVGTRVEPGAGDAARYVMALEVAVPDGMRLDALEAALEAVAAQQGVEAELRPAQGG